MRVFVAIDIDPEIKEAMARFQRRLASEAGIDERDVKWVRPQAMHLTLKFLGEITDQQLVEVCRAVEEATEGHKSFEMEIETVGYFGGRSARVLWVGTGRGSQELGLLQQDIEQRLVKSGWPAEQRRFTAHLTVCRIKNARAGEKLVRLADAYKDLKLGTTQAEAVTVYESRLRPGGPVYTVLGNYALEGRK